MGSVITARDREYCQHQCLHDLITRPVDDYFQACKSIGNEPQRAHLGRMMFRVAPEVHRRAILAAEYSRKSFNQRAEASRKVLQMVTASDIANGLPSSTQTNSEGLCLPQSPRPGR
nr:toxin-antitoxin system HicB family antitoxin [Ensifer adhaerens]